MYIIVTILLISLLLFFLFNWLMGYKTGNIIIDFNKCYFNFNEYIQAIRQKLEDDGREVTYKGAVNLKSMVRIIFSSSET